MEFMRWYSRNNWTAWDTFIAHLLDFRIKKMDLGRYAQTISQKGAFMGLGMRVFIVKDDGSLEHLPFGKYNQLLRRDAKARLPEYAGKRVRCAVMVVETINRKPIEIVKSQFSYLLFDSDGRLHAERDEGEARLAMEMLEPVTAEKDKQVIDARHMFARKRYVRQYKWEPSPEIERTIRKAIFGRIEAGRS